MTTKPIATLKFVRDILQTLKEEAIDKNGCLFNVHPHTNPQADTRHVTIEVNIPLDVEEDPELSVDLFKSIYDKIYQVSENNGGPGITESEIVNINDEPYYRFYPTIEIDEKEYTTLINDENTTTAVMNMVENRQTLNNMATSETTSPDTYDRTVTLKSFFTDVKKKYSTKSCLKDSITDRECQKDIAISMAITTIMVTGLEIYREYKKNPRKNGETRLQRAKRVIGITLKKPRTFLFTGVCSLLVGSCTLGYHTNKRWQAK